MPLRVLIVPDKFKGTLTARAAAELIARGWHEVRPEDQLELLPMSDGGDGFGEVLASALGLEARHCSTVDAAHRPHQATWWWQAQSHTAIIESAQVIGLALLPRGQFHPFELDTFGLGSVIDAARAAGAERCLIGIGGSATNDAGFGLARALGWRFSGPAGRDITQWTSLTDLDRITPPSPSEGTPPEYLVAVDVQNTLLGPEGATRVYGPQKGLRPKDFPIAEDCLQHLVDRLKDQTGCAAASEPGTGAAGGLGFGLRCFLGAQLESGFRLFARYANLEQKIRSAELVITGEGAIDPSTWMGKGVGEIGRLSQDYGVPCLGLAGTLVGPKSDAAEAEPFTALYGMVPHVTSVENALAEPHHWLPRLANLAARKWTQCAAAT